MYLIMVCTVLYPLRIGRRGYFSFAALQSNRRRDAMSCLSKCQPKRIVGCIRPHGQPPLRPAANTAPQQEKCLAQGNRPTEDLLPRGASISALVQRTRCNARKHRKHKHIRKHKHKHKQTPTQPAMASSAIRFTAAASPLLARTTAAAAPRRLLGGTPAARRSAEEEDGSGAVARGQGSAGWTAGEFHSVEQVLEENLGAEDLASVKRVLYGLNQGAPVQKLPVPLKAQELARKYDYGTCLPARVCICQCLPVSVCCLPPLLYLILTSSLPHSTVQPATSAATPILRNLITHPYLD